jgi:hypothetical protein
LIFPYAKFDLKFITNIKQYSGYNYILENLKKDDTKELDKQIKDIKFMISNNRGNQDELVLAFEKNYGLIINHSMVFGNDEYQLYKETVQGEIKLTELGEVLSIKNIGIRNTFLMYSYSKDINVENKKSSSVSSIFQLDKEIKSIYLDSEIANEKLSISVVNATGINGLGKRVSRYVSNMGGRVVDVSSRNENLNKSVIIYKGESKSLDLISDSVLLNNKAIKSLSSRSLFLESDTFLAFLFKARKIALEAFLRS